MKILLKNIDNDLKISKEEIPSIINVFVYSIILFFYLVCLFAFGFWPASLLLLWAGILYFRPEKNLNSIMKSLGIALITCLIAYIVFQLRLVILCTISKITNLDLGGKFCHDHTIKLIQ